jgi:hypothetical protein
MLFLDEGDYLSAITLAGAAEALTGQMLSASGATNAVESQARAMEKLSERFMAPSLTRTEAIAALNEVRDWLKHRRTGDAANLTFDAREAAEEFIDRAMINIVALTNNVPPQARRFDAWRAKRDQG